MATPVFIKELRSLIGTRPLWLSVALAVVLDDGGHVLLCRRADNGTWALPGGIIEPGEEPADAVARECFEETGVVAVPWSVTSITVSPEITYANGDQVQYLEVTFRCRQAGGEARVNDDESVEVAWFSLSGLPELDARILGLIDRATSGTHGADFVFCGEISAGGSVDQGPQRLRPRPGTARG